MNYACHMEDCGYAPYACVHVSSPKLKEMLCVSILGEHCAPPLPSYPTSTPPNSGWKSQIAVREKIKEEALREIQRERDREKLLVNTSIFSSWWGNAAKDTTIDSQVHTQAQKHQVLQLRSPCVWHKIVAPPQPLKWLHTEREREREEKKEGKRVRLRWEGSWDCGARIKTITPSSADALQLMWPKPPIVYGRDESEAGVGRAGGDGVYNQDKLLLLWEYHQLPLDSAGTLSIGGNNRRWSEQGQFFSI